MCVCVAEPEPDTTRNYINDEQILLPVLGLHAAFMSLRKSYNMHVIYTSCGRLYGRISLPKRERERGGKGASELPRVIIKLQIRLCANWLAEQSLLLFG